MNFSAKTTPFINQTYRIYNDDTFKRLTKNELQVAFAFAVGSLSNYITDEKADAQIEKFLTFFKGIKIEND